MPDTRGIHPGRVNQTYGPLIRNILGPKYIPMMDCGDLSDHNNVMASYLPPKLYAKLRDKVNVFFFDKKEKEKTLRNINVTQFHIITKVL